jgi:multiple RNA-binding domain-containing protein 1
LVSQSTKSTKRKRQIEKEQHTSKILVKNIPFQANIKEIRELFRVFGELKFVRMPKKIDDEHHRGFGFVDFVSKNDAKVRLGKTKT